jgi:hypothetical protein
MPAAEPSAGRARPLLSWAATVALLGVGAVLTWLALGPLAQRHMPVAAAALGALTKGVDPPVAAMPAPAPTPSRAPLRLKRDGYERIHGGVLIAPYGFEPAPDGSYDLLLHFHGDVGIVRESIEVAGLNAAVAIINLGIGSGVYSDDFKEPGRFERLLGQIDRALVRRGLVKPKLRRLALSGWSAGYGAINTILERRRPPKRGHDPLDAILVLDGIHCGYLAHDGNKLDEARIQPFIRAARAAAEGQLMFSVTHSEIDPVTYASSTKTAALLLERVGSEVRHDAVLPLPAHLELDSSRNRNERMVPTSDTHVGMLRVQGFQGNTKEHHAAHLIQMAAVALPDLRKRWSQKPQ